jgi:DNA-binding MarR family transcriptional regulator
MRLAAAYQLDKTSLSLALKRLAGRGLVASNRNEGDRRYHALALTAAGRAVLQRATRRIEAQERAMDALLGPGERALLIDRLRRIATAFAR